MVLLSSSLNLRELFLEIFAILKKSEPELNEVWYKLSEFEFFANLKENEYHFLIDQLPFVKLERWNHLAIDKISFILEAMEYVRKDIQDLSKLLDFKGFESLIEEILKRNGFFTTRNYYFSDKSYYRKDTNQNRYEIDVIGFKKHLMLCIDAKQWNRKDSFSSMNKAANLQLQRAIALEKNLESFSNLLQSLVGLSSCGRIKPPISIVPFIVSLEENSSRFNNQDVPLVSIYKLNSFLQELSFNMPNIRVVKVKKLYFQKQIL